jgi:hypothetical protein
VLSELGYSRISGTLLQQSYLFFDLTRRRSGTFSIQASRRKTIFKLYFKSAFNFGRPS